MIVDDGPFTHLHLGSDHGVGADLDARADHLFGGSFELGSLALKANLNLAALIQLLIKDFNMQVLLTPKLYTSDNQEAEFFDGQDVPVLTETRISAEGATTVSDVRYTPIGASLRVRPHITQEGTVDLTINLEVSRVVPGESVLGNLIFDRRETTTHVIVQDGQTVMLSGIVRQEDFDEVRKVPLLGDLPLVGPLFRNVNKARRNRELVAFITPHVIASRAAADAHTAPYLRVLEQIPREPGFPDEGVIDSAQPPARAPATSPGR